tara:strand:+ start:7885 stop:9540 length:1656 start_codon:yes stop_codon:yes gene_type:complete
MERLRKVYYLIKNSPLFSKVDLRYLGIKNTIDIHYNLSYPELINREILSGEGTLLNSKYGDVYSIDTGIFTGRSPKDKWIVKTPGTLSEKNIWWGDVNQPIDVNIFDKLYEKTIYHMNTLDECYVYDGYCGTSYTGQKKIRFIHEMAWQQHFVKNMFIDIGINGIDNFPPDITIINACSVKNEDWKEHGLHSDIAIAFNIERKIGIIMGTWYGGENKKGIFSLMNYWLPMDNIMTMHCSANVGERGDTALFFGLSGTGKTTLSTDPKRRLIGDDEHGWDENGIFNLEGGCYAKTVNLIEEEEPEIYKAIRLNALLENVSYNENFMPEYDNIEKTQNGRVSYPIEHIENYYREPIANHPKNIIFLTCDAFGVLPPISKLSHDQAIYHFLSGYTSKIAGTERGITEPQATFSSCFGEAFLTLHPTRYAELFKKKLKDHGSNVYLVNTGWSGGGYYSGGKRISIDQTRKCIHMILSESMDHIEYYKDPLFGFDVPINVLDLDETFLNPRNSWLNKEEYDKESFKLASMFIKNYKRFTDNNIFDYSQYGPIISKL